MKPKVAAAVAVLGSLVQREQGLLSFPGLAFARGCVSFERNHFLDQVRDEWDKESETERDRGSQIQCKSLSPKA